MAHLLYAPALQRGEVMVIEDFLPVPGVEIEVNVPEKVKKVYQIPDGKKVDFTRKGNKLIVKVPTFTKTTMPSAAMLKILPKDAVWVTIITIGELCLDLFS